MLIGRKEEGKGTSNYPRLLQVMNSRGFTILEVFLISVLMIWIITAVTSVLQIGEFSNTVSTARIELQQEVRRAMDTMITDLRQTSREKLSVELANGSLPFFSDLSNDTAFTDPLFKVCLGYNSSAKAVNWSSNEIGYTFNASNNVIVRTDNSTSQAWQFNNISDLEFRKLDVNLLGINITGEKVARGNLRPTFSLQAEVRLRNE